jgi:ubiquinol-cytochrome c reductase cytochrome b subunit
MFASLLILLAMPLLDTARIRGSQFRPFMKFFFWVFVTNFFILMWIGSQHPNSPFVEVGQVATALYFSWFVLIVPVIGIIENTLMDLATTTSPVGR